MRYIIIDFETVSQADLTKVGSFLYAHHPTTRMLCMAYIWDDGTQGVIFPGQQPPDIGKDTMILAFNVQFERPCWHKFFGEPPPLDRWHDIQAACAAKGLPLNLEDVAIALGLSQQKDVMTLSYIKSLSKSNTDVIDYDRVAAYCLNDVQVEKAVHERVGWLTPADRAWWLVHTKMNERGLLLDIPAIEKAKQIVEREEAALAKRFKMLTGLNPTQTVAFANWLRDQGVETDNVTKETIGELIDEIVDPAIKEALVIRQTFAKSSTKKLSAMLATANAIGESRGLLQFHGTGPGRSAGRLWQPQNLPRPADMDKNITPDVAIELIMEDQLDKYTTKPLTFISQSLRHMIVARPGKVFISGDYVGIQLRVLLALAGQYDKCEMLAAGKNLYEDMGKSIYGRPIDKHKNITEYTIAKNAVLGLGFQMSAATFQAKYGKHLDFEFLSKVVRTYREWWAPKVPELWLSLELASFEAVVSGREIKTHGLIFRKEPDYLTVELPSGRKLWYYKPEVCQSKFDRLTWRYHSPKGPITVFGGLLTENIVMAIEVDIIRHAAITLSKKGYDLALDVHDELLWEVPEDVTEDEIRKAMEQVPQWAKDMKIPINVETWKGRRYRK